VDFLLYNLYKESLYSSKEAKLTRTMKISFIFFVFAIFVSTGGFSESLQKRYYFPECQTQIPSPLGWHAYNNTKSMIGFVSVLREKAAGPSKEFKTGLSFYTNYDKILKANVNDTESLAEISFSEFIKKIPPNVEKQFYYLEGTLGKFKFMEINPGNPNIPIIAVGVIKNHIGCFQVIIGSPPDIWNINKPILLDMVKNIKIIMASRPEDEVVYSQMGYPNSWIFKQRDNRQRKNLLERFGNLEVGMSEEKYQEIMKYDLQATGSMKSEMVNKTPGWIMKRPALNEDCYVDLYGVDILCICEELFYVHIKDKKIKDFKLINRTLPDDFDSQEWENLLVRIPENKNEYNMILEKIKDWTTIPDRVIRAVEKLKLVKTGMSEHEYLTIAKGFILRIGGGGVIRVVPGVHEFISSVYNKEGINADYIYAFRMDEKVVPLGQVIIRGGMVQKVIIESIHGKSYEELKREIEREVEVQEKRQMEARIKTEEKMKNSVAKFKEELEKEYNKRLAQIEAKNIVPLDSVSHAPHIISGSKYIEARDLKLSKETLEKYKGQKLTVSFDILINESGRVTETKIKGYLLTELQSQLNKILKTWLYIPADKDKVKVKVWLPVVLTIAF
jgi:hypothetical protein